MTQAFHPEDMIAILLVITFFSIIIWYYLIQSATSSSTVVYNLRSIVKLLKLIAKKNGASDEEIDDILK